MTRRVTALAGALLVVSLVVRVYHRGAFIPGWDVVGAAQGLCLLHRGPAAVWHWLARHRRDNLLAWNVYGAPITLLPGALTWLWPSEWWAHVTTFLLGSLALALLWRATEGRLDVLLLALLGLATAQSWLVVGFPYVTCWLPHAVALWAMFRARWTWLSLGLGALACELAWHGQELGQTVFVPLFAGALFLGGAPAFRRLGWAALGGWELWLVLQYPSFNVAGHLREWYARLIWPLWYWPELPLVPLLGLLALRRLPRQQPFWSTCLGAAWALVLWCALRSFTAPEHGVGTVWPRRFLLVDFYTLGTLLVADLQARARGVLWLAALCQLTAVGWWALHPLPLDRGQLIPLLFTQSAIDYHVDPTVTAQVKDWITQVRAGQTLTLDYGFDQQSENFTDPQGALQRLYLAVGDTAFRTRVRYRPSPVPWECFPRADGSFGSLH